MSYIWSLTMKLKCWDVYGQGEAHIWRRKISRYDYEYLLNYQMVWVEDSRKPHLNMQVSKMATLCSHGRSFL